MEKSNGVYEGYYMELAGLATGINPESLTEEQEEMVREVYGRIVESWEDDEELSDADFDSLLEMLEDLGFSDFDH